MAIIGKIREKSWLILIVVGGALVTFIFTSQGPGGGAGEEDQYGLGTIYGEKVDGDAFNTKIAEAEEAARQNAARQGQQPQPVDQNGVWQQFIQDELLQKEYDALGIQVSADEFDAYLFGRDGFEVLPDLKQAFQDSITGEFNPKLLEQRIDMMETSEDPEVQKQWEMSKKYYTEQRQKQKYFDIVGQGVYITNLEAKDEYYAQQEKKSISYVFRRYSEIPDEDIKVTDDKLKAYFDSNKEDKKYENKFSERTIRFADIRVEPSKKDSSDFEGNLSDLVKEFKGTNNDSTFVVNNSEVPFFARKAGYRPEGSENSLAKQGFTYPAAMDSVFTKAQVGDVIGPYMQNGSQKIVKVVDKSSLMSVRHILIGAQKADTAAVELAQKKTDSLMKLVNKNNFEDYVTEFSDDPGSKNTGGKYADFVDGEMVPEFSEFAKTKPVGHIGYVQTDFGFHIIEVLDRQENVVPHLAIVQKTLAPSLFTVEAKEKEAYELLKKMYNKIEATSDEMKKVAAFDTLAKEEGMLVRPVMIRDNKPVINGFTSSYAETELFKLAFNTEAKVGDIISSPIKDGDRWVIAIVAAIKVKGETKFEDVKRMVEADYIEEQKYKRLMSKMKGKSLEQLAKDGNTAVIPSEIIFGNSQLGKTSNYEPSIVGALFSGLADGKMTQPLKGKQGVYVVKIEKTIKAPQAANYDKEKDQMLGAFRGRIQNLATQALVDAAEVVDNREFRKIGLRR
jgi:peptidyl-prolyl cis-trans isomerase D